MAFTEFCCRNGGNNLYAGTLDGIAEPSTTPLITYASGTWVAATGVFTVASGDPVAAGVTVGQFASVYPDGTTGSTVFVGRITARTTTTITVSLTAKSGTAPVNGTSNRTLVVGGAWSGPAGTSGFPLTFVTNTLMDASSHPLRVNMKNDKTYSVTAIMTVAGTNKTIQGYTTTFGDTGRFIIDGGATGTCYNVMNLSGATQVLADCIMRNNGDTDPGGDPTGNQPLLVMGSLSGALFRCVFHDGRGGGVFIGSSGCTLIECEAYANGIGNGATNGAICGFGWFCQIGPFFINCISHHNTTNDGVHTADGFSGFGSGTVNGVTAVFIHCISHNNNGYGFNHSALASLRGNAIFFGCDAWSNTVGGIATSFNNCLSVIMNSNMLKNGTGYSTQGTTSVMLDLRNAIGSGTSVNSVTPPAPDVTTQLHTIDRLTYAADAKPWVDPDNGDFRINLAAAQGTGRSNFTQTGEVTGGTVGYPDIGAAQHQQPPVHQRVIGG